MMAGAWSVRVAGVLLLLGSTRFADLLRTVSASRGSCEENLVPADVLAKYAGRECPAGDSCTEAAGILDFYNYKVNNGSSTNITCLVHASPAPEAGEITFTSDGHLLPSSESGTAIFRLSDDGKTAVKIYNVASVTKEQLYSCHFVRLSSADNVMFNYSKTLKPAVYLQPQLMQAPVVEAQSGKTGSRYAMWRAWNASVDGGDGPIERYMLCYETIRMGINNCILLGGSWHTWVSTSLDELQPGVVYRLYVYAERQCSMGRGPPSRFVDYPVPCLAPKGLLTINAHSVVINHEVALINVTWPVVSLRDPCDAPVTVTVMLKISTSSEDISSVTVQASNESVVLSGSPDTEYVVEAFFHNSQQLKSAVTHKLVVTGSPFPHPPAMVDVYMCNSSSMLAEWKYDGKSRDSIQLYEVLYRRTNDASDVASSLGCSIEKPFTNLECVINGLNWGTKYLFKVRAKSSAGYSNESGVVERDFTYTASQPIKSVNNVSRSDQSIELKWRPPTCTGGYSLSSYTVTCSAGGIGSPSVFVAPSMNSVNVTGLSPDTEYYCTVSPETAIRKGNPRRYTVRTLASRPSQPPRPKLDSYGMTATAIGLRFPSTPHASLIKVVVLRLGDGSGSKDPGEMSPEDLDRCSIFAGSDPDSGDGLACYTAAQFAATTAGHIVFVIGDNGTYGGFYNAPLRTGSRYAVFFGVGVVGDGVPVFSYSRLDESVLVGAEAEHVDSRGHGGGADALPGAGVIVGSVCAAVVALLVVALGLLTYMRKKKKHTLFSLLTRTPAGEKDLELQEKGRLLDGHNGHGGSDMGGGGGEDLSTQPDGEPVYDNVELKRYPVLLSELASYVVQKKLDNSLKKEYNLIPWGLMSKCDVAKRPENKQRNRYNNIIAYDDSRVLLVLNDPEVSSDYVNANYIDGYNSPKYYIATQGPLRSTIKDFWHMVWHERTPAIIMLTNIIEQGKSKCEQYWPSSDESIAGYGGLTVSLERTRSWASFDVHHLLLTKGDEKRQIALFHFRDWPDHGVPSQATALLAFLSAVRSASAGAAGPLVSHCSAGVGRTGTYIALDILLRQAAAEGKVDVYGAVCSMRKQRCNMIQTFDQYVFLHEAILEATHAGNVSFELPAFVEKYDKLFSQSEAGELPADTTEAARSASEDSAACFEDEYNNLKLVECGVPEPRAVVGPNARRNRDVSVVPCHGTCVPLQNPGLTSSEYINACFVDDYLQKGALISTQTPLPDTVGHFWKMLYDQRVSTVVMLNKSTNEEEDEEQQFTVYWPTSTEWNGEYSHVSIQLMSESQLDDVPDSEVTVRTFALTPKYEQAHRSSRLPHTVRQYACDFWPEELDVPASRAKFVDLLLRVFRVCKESASAGPLVVHCLDGAKQSGLYLACHILMQQAVTDGVVDVPQVVKLIRRFRPQFITSAEQLRCCYNVVLELIRSGRLPRDACTDST